MDTLNERELDRKLTDEAKEGDKWLRIYYAIHGRTYGDVTVTRSTKTRITFSDEAAIMKASGNIVGSSSSSAVTYLPLTEARILERRDYDRAQAAHTAGKNAMEDLSKRFKRDRSVKFQEAFTAMVEKLLAEHPEES